MISFPNCKINLGLNIVRKRTDGYHDLETVFYPVAIKDALEVIEATKFNFTLTGLAINDISENNICVKAYNLLKKDFPHLPAVDIHLHKTIPTGAGLGGGSSDGAFMLALLNKKFQLNIDTEQLMEYALQLGSDCPFFIINTPCFGTSRGETLTPVHVDLADCKLVLVNPAIHISTKEAFSELTPSIPAKSIREIIQQPVESWKDDLKNDFEKSIFKIYPEIENIRNSLYAAGAVYASMTGTGSTVFGVFKSGENLNFKFPAHYKCLFA